MSPLRSVDDVQFSIFGLQRGSLASKQANGLLRHGEGLCQSVEHAAECEDVPGPSGGAIVQGP